MRVAWLLAALVEASYALSKSDKFEKEVTASKHATTEAPVVGIKKQEIGERVRYPPRVVTIKTILEEHEEMDDGERRFHLPATLAYITPWNSQGYSRATQIAHKLTHVSPVWLQLRPQSADGARACRVEGSHDIDHGWMADLRTNNSALKIVPRVILDGWEAEELTRFLADEEWGLRCMNDLFNIIQRNGFDGIVLETWLAALSSMRPADMPLLLEFLTSWGDEIHKRDMQMILPVPPPVNSDMSINPLIFNADHLRALVPSVDYIQVMTYDLKSVNGKSFPLAPFEWVEATIHAILDEAPELAGHVMIGLNHYGLFTDFHAQKQEPITQDRYLELLSDEKAKLRWDAKVKEHAVRVGMIDTYYPSLTSIEERMILAAEYGVGVGIWDLGQGLNYFSRLL